MSKPVLRFKGFEHCKPKELVRGDFGEGTRWAVCCKAGQRAVALILEGESRWQAIWLENDYGYLDEFDRNNCLSYGDNYDILPNHHDLCEVSQAGSNSNLISVPGSYIYASTDDSEMTGYIVARLDQRLAYLNLSLGTLNSEPGGSRAAFRNWTLWKDDMSSTTTSVPLITSSQ